MNIVSKVGACGFVPVLNQWLKKLAINVIRVDTEMNPIRDSKGFCIICKPGEKGLAVWHFYRILFQNLKLIK